MVEEKKEANRKKILGTVVSVKGDKTAIIKMEILKTHPLYGKKIKWSKRYMIHDENNELKLGEYVEAIEGQKISKKKSFYLNRKINKNLKNQIKSKNNIKRHNIIGF